MNGKIILNLAVSLDGYIATEDGGYDWIVGDGDATLNTEQGFDFGEFLEGIDVVVMGSKCYEQGMAGDYASKIVYVATSKEREDTDNIRFINGDIVSVLEKERAEGKNIYLFGGGQVIDPFIKADQIDEYIIAVIPTILGEGRKLFLGNNPTIKLHLQNHIIDGGITISHYKKRK